MKSAGVDRVPSRLRKFFRLESSDKRLLVASACSLLLAQLALSVLPFRFLVRFLTIAGNRPSALSADRFQTARVLWAVDVASALLPATENCLIRAVAVVGVLSWLRHPAHLRFGVTRNAGGELQAHAWVESNGHVVIGSPGLDVFTPMCLTRFARR